MDGDNAPRWRLCKLANCELDEGEGTKLLKVELDALEDDWDDEGLELLKPKVNDLEDDGPNDR